MFAPGHLQTAALGQLLDSRETGLVKVKSLPRGSQSEMAIYRTSERLAAGCLKTGAFCFPTVDL